MIWLSYMNLTTYASPDYELIDSGNGKKLERYGSYILERPDPQALWKPRYDQNQWNKADGVFIREGKKTSWKTKKTLPEKWTITFGGLQLEIAPTTFKHTGLFPEHVSTWEWMRSVITKRRQAQPAAAPRILNLFGYTGCASLACASAGATVVHVDGSKLAIGWAKRNQTLSEIPNDSIRWILDDVTAFLKREIKRGNTYDAIIMDPPAFGRGPDGEVWEIEECLAPLLEQCQKVLSDRPLFVIMNGYAAGFSSISYANNLQLFADQHGGTIEHGELTIAEKDGRLLPSGIYAKWVA